MLRQFATFARCSIGLQFNLPELLRAFEMHNSAGFLNGLLTNTIALATLAIGSWFELQSNLNSLIFVQTLFGTVSAIAVLSILFSRTSVFLPFQLRLRYVFAFSFPYLLFGLASLSFTTVDTIAVSLFSPNAAVASYGLSSKFAAFISVPAQITSSLAMPTVVRNMAMHGFVERRELNRLFFPSRLVAVITWLSFLFLGRVLLVRFFGEAYACGYVPLLILGLFHLQSSFFVSDSIVLQMSESQTELLKLSVFFAFLAIALQMLLCGFLGVNGAAIASLVAGVGFSCAQRHLVRIKKLAVLN